jgi:hypothetical protein
LKQSGSGIYGIAGIGNRVNIERCLDTFSWRTLLYNTKPISFPQENPQFNFITAGKSQNRFVMETRVFARAKLWEQEPGLGGKDAGTSSTLK